MTVGPFVDLLDGSAPSASPVGTGGAGASGSADFTIGGMSFRAAPSDENPYARSTAQFQKQQLDTTNTYGDQSLLGYWTRGQYDFSHGEGVPYYEVEQSTTTFTGLEHSPILERYNYGHGVDPFTPGQVRLLPTPTDVVAGESFSNVTWVGDQALVDAGSLRFEVAGALVTYTPSGATVVSVAQYGNSGYALVSTTANDIRKVALTATPSDTVLYTHTNPLKLWAAKDRIFAVDATTDTWYTFAINPSGALPVAVADSDIAFRASDTAQPWCLTETPGPVLVARAGQVFAITVDSSGSVPTLSGGIQVASLPAGESVYDMCYDAGYVVLRTSLGLRVAQVADSGQVQYGPLLFDVASGPGTGTMVALGTKVYATLGSALYIVDVSQEIGTGLTYSYVKAMDLAGPAVVSTRTGGIVVLGTPNTYQELGSTLGSGSVTTGYHRYASLENKKFQSVRVSLSGSGGTVTVSRVDANGAATSLLTIDLAVDNPIVTIGLQMPAPTELVAIRFDMVPQADATTVGPVLLGYQLKALPAPERQRMIQIPLLLNDEERRRPTRASGRKGGAWARLSLLEDMERGGGTFAFTDHRTGETGECYIESVDFKGTTPPSAHSSGFGGVLTLTIRKL